MAESVFALMDARGITGTDVVCINLYNSGPTLHVEPECLLRAFAGDGLTYVERLGGMHAQAHVNGIRVVSMCITPGHIAKLRAIGKPQVPFMPAESSEVEL